MEGLDLALSLLPAMLRTGASRRIPRTVEELRIRVGRRPCFAAEGREHPFAEEAVSEELLQTILEKATGASIHTAAQALAEGYWSYHGLRVGVCGTAVWRDGAITGFRELSSIAIRICRERRGILDAVASQIIADGYRNTLVLAPPGGGKTTALRELIRLLSEDGKRVAVVDERNEIAAKDGAVARFDLGPSTDVLTGVEKARGALQLLRSMGPEILAVDEIASDTDVEALCCAAGSGVGILASAHGRSASDLERRPGFRALLERGAFSCVLCIEGEGERRSYRVEEIGR